MLEVLVFTRQLFVILLDLRDNGVPRGGEVKERECGPALVQVLHELLQALGGLIVLILVCQECAHSCLFEEARACLQECLVEHL